MSSNKRADNLPYEKVGKNEPVCIADEVPFDIPESWEWVRMSSIISLTSGQDMAPDKYNNSHSGIPYITGASNIENDQVIINRWTDSPKAIAYKGDLLLTCKGTVGTMAFLKEDKVHIARQIMAISSPFGVNLRYVRLFLDSYVTALRSAAKSMIPGIGRNDVLTILFPLPPETEQIRILEKYDELVQPIKDYSVAEQKARKLNDDFPEKLKKSILQWAVQGKLVPQDPSDEPASVLLERIQEEKARLVKEGKIKKDKNESIIFRRDNSHYEKLGNVERCIDDEIPFEIPHSWAWIRLSTICKSIADGDHQPPPQTSSGIPFLVISDVSSGQIDFSKTRFVPQSYYQTLQENRVPEMGDLLFTVTGSYGIVIPIISDHQFCFQRHMALLKPCMMDTQFLSVWLTTPLVFKQCKAKATGTAQKTVGLTTLKNLLIPIPTQKEQAKIMEKLNRILPCIKSI